MRGDLELENIHTQEELRIVANLNEAVPLTLNPGDLIIWHPYLIHGNNAEKFAVKKILFINGFAYPGANVGSKKDAIVLMH